MGRCPSTDRTARLSARCLVDRSAGRFAVGSGEFDDRAARVALTTLAEPGNRAVWGMVQRMGAPEALERLLRGEAPTGALRASARARFEGADPRALAEATLFRAERIGARIVVPSDDEWPSRVDELAVLELDTGGTINQDVRPPLCFWVRGAGRLDEWLGRSVAIVGARAATDYGRHVATDLAYGLAAAGWTVVSGGAFGIDAASHLGALAAEGRTVAVLACGVDRPYPAGNAGMFDRIAGRGILMSEWPPGAEPQKHRFLIRNRVIAAATAGTVLVEAAARSGAIQTMNRVLALNRPAMVVPGPVTSAMSVGCHELLRSRPDATLVTEVAHVLEGIGRIGEYWADPARGPARRRDELDEESALVLEALPRKGAIPPEELAARAGLAVRTVLRRLSLLELAGLVERREGGVALVMKY